MLHSQPLSRYNCAPYEADLSTLQTKTSQATRFSPSLRDLRRKKGAWEEEKERPQTARSGLIQTPHLTLHIAALETKEQLTVWRIGVSAKLVPLATERNRWKRRIREVLEKQQDLIRPGFLASFHVRDSKGIVNYAVLEREILELLRRTGLWG